MNIDVSDENQLQMTLLCDITIILDYANKRCYWVDIDKSSSAYDLNKKAILYGIRGSQNIFWVMIFPFVLGEQDCSMRTPMYQGMQ